MGQQRTYLSTTGRIMDATMERMNVVWMMDGKRMDRDAFRLDALTPAVLIPAAARARRMALADMLPPWRFERDRHGLFGVNMAVDRGSRPLTAVDDTFTALLAADGAEQAIAGLESLSEYPGYRDCIQSNGSTRRCDARAAYVVLQIAYGRSLGVEAANGETPSAVSSQTPDPSATPRRGPDLSL